jgi:predicted GNAT family acetyltransferase
MSATIQHDERAQKFSVVVESQEAYLDYAVRDETTLEFRQTFVPEALRGGDLARRLVAAGFAHARERGFRVIPSCGYVRRQVERTEEYRELTTSETT